MYTLKTASLRIVAGLMMFACALPARADIAPPLGGGGTLLADSSSEWMVLAGISLSVAVVTGFFLKRGSPWVRRVFYGAVGCSAVFLMAGLFSPSRPIHNRGPRYYPIPQQETEVDAGTLAAPQAPSDDVSQLQTPTNEVSQPQD